MAKQNFLLCVLEKIASIYVALMPFAKNRSKALVCRTVVRNRPCARIADLKLYLKEQLMSK